MRSEFSKYVFKKWKVKIHDPITKEILCTQLHKLTALSEMNTSAERMSESEQMMWKQCDVSR